MANNPYVNKVVYGNQTVMDISDTTASEGDVAEGEVFYKGSGQRSVGTGRSGHVMNPTPASGVTESDVVTAVNGAIDTNDEVASLFGIQRWSNMKTFRVMITSGIGHYGIGEWQWILNNPTEQDEIGWGWYYNDVFKKLGDLSKMGYDYELKFKFDPSSGEVVTLGGYKIDTTTGYLCILFANYVVDIAHTKIAVDIIVTRNDIQYV